MTRRTLNQRTYGIGNFLLDIFLLIITGGIWGIYLLFKFFRSIS